MLVLKPLFNSEFRQEFLFLYINGRTYIFIDRYAARWQVRTCVRSAPSLWCSLVLFFLDVKFQVLSKKIVKWWYSRFLSLSSRHWPTCGLSAFKVSLPSQVQEVVLASARLFAPPRRPLALGRRKPLIPGFI